ncbi:GNAT family N-acetyltransferase [Salinibius halmophilus]|uniref:GNAT family N-acetyltransferase n=1 Tax=Salinibius halmophilus TaxID=1853216 RepID=UPI0018F4C21E|nr:GNAT family N-acetyltransferase [Salinibius halmophilus]
MAKWVTCEADRHLATISRLLNEQIRYGTALYDLVEKTPEDMQAWFDAKLAANLPIIGLESSSGELLGFATASRFRPQQATARTFEHSLYVDASARGQGLGKQLLSGIMDWAQNSQVHTLIGVIDADNTASIAMHKKAGFTEQGRLNQVAYKFDRWLDAVFMQKLFN